MEGQTDFMIGKERPPDSELMEEPLNWILEASCEQETVLDRLGQQIARMRREKCMTQDEVACGARVSRNTVSLVENGKTSVTLPTLAAIAKGLGVTLYVGLLSCDEPALNRIFQDV